MPYKVVREDISGDLFGAFVGFQDDHKIQPMDTPYRIGEWFETREDMAELGYYLMYFDNLRTARRFQRKYTSTLVPVLPEAPLSPRTWRLARWEETMTATLPLFVHECEVRDIMPVPEWIVVAHKTNTVNDIKRQLLNESVRLHKPFPGTRMARAIKLGPRVPEE